MSFGSCCPLVDQFQNFSHLHTKICDAQFSLSSFSLAFLLSEVDSLVKWDREIEVAVVMSQRGKTAEKIIKSMFLFAGHSLIKLTSFSAGVVPLLNRSFKLICRVTRRVTWQVTRGQSCSTSGFAETRDGTRLMWTPDLRSVEQLRKAPTGFCPLTVHNKAITLSCHVCLGHF